MKPLVVVIQNQKFELQDLNELRASIFGENYLNLSQEERLKLRYEKA